MFATPSLPRRLARAIAVLAGCALATASAVAAKTPEPPVETPSLLEILNSAKTTLLLAPIDTSVTLRFGPTTDRVSGHLVWHRAVDYGAPEGAAVVAPAAGTVTRADARNDGYGNVLELDHGGGLITRYAHLAGFDVNVGQHVTAGEAIARVGHSGAGAETMAPHLHFEVLTLRLHSGEEYFIDPQMVLPTPRR